MPRDVEAIIEVLEFTPALVGGIVDAIESGDRVRAEELTEEALRRAAFEKRRRNHA